MSRGEGRGRPTTYDPDKHVELAEAWATAGLTDDELADKLKIDRATLYRWKNKYPEFRDSIKKGKEPVDDRVEDSLLNRALGYSHPKEKFFNNNGEIITVDTTKHYPPDTAAAMAWLKNRRAHKWRDRYDHKIGTDTENSGENKITIEIIKPTKRSSEIPDTRKA